MLRPTTIDVETFAIAGRPAYPRLPVGVAVKEWGKKARYYGFGHVVPDHRELTLTTNHRWNNAHAIDALRAIEKAYANPDGVLMHNSKFDLEVIATHFEVPPPPPERCHDTMFLAFLYDPNARAIDLKSLAKRLLDWPASERDELNDWLTTHQPVPDVRISTSTKGKNPPGAYIAYAPTDVVGPYAIGDVDRTAALFEKLYPHIVETGMLDAYRREQHLLPVLLDMEQRGIAVDVAKLENDVRLYNASMTLLEAWVRRHVDADPNVNLASGAQLVEALEAAGAIDVDLLAPTKTGKKSSTQESLTVAIANKQLAGALAYMSRLRTCLHTFMEPWLETAQASGGRIYTQWHQTRGGGGGARTGRLSSSPNFQNIPVEFDPIFSSDASLALTRESRIDTTKLKLLVKTLPKAPVRNLPPLPLCRRYLTAYPGQTLAGRDFMSQELRILAHFEDGTMMQAYLDDPAIDFHQHVTDMMRKNAGTAHLSRREAKVVAFSILYGAGVGKTASQLGCSVEQAKTILDTYHRMFPGIRVFQNALKYRARTNQPMRTIGGRLYYCEPPIMIDGELRQLDYKMPNTIIQGSASDQTKDAMIKFHHIAGPGKLVLSVHDELVISTKAKKRDMLALRDAVNTSTLDIPVLSDGEYGTNWAEMEKSEI